MIECFLMDGDCVVSSGKYDDVITAKSYLENYPLSIEFDLYVLHISKHPSSSLVVNEFINKTGWLQLHKDCLLHKCLGEEVFDCNKYFMKLNNS